MKPLHSLVAFALIAFSGNAISAAPFETLGGPVGTGSNLQSSLGLTIVAPDLNNLTITIAPTPIIGVADAEVSLDGVGNGSASIFSSNLLLTDVTDTASTLLGDFEYTLTGVGIEIVAGPVAVSGNNFSINSATPGLLSLNQGTVQLAGPLGINETINLTTDPIEVPFLDLGTSILAGTADNDLSGNDTTPSGAEINVAWSGASAIFEVDLLGSPVPLTITLTGNGLSLGSVVPEPTSGLFLAGLMVGAGSIVRRRRR